jgi:amino acid adenylation domain-containing protein
LPLGRIKTILADAGVRFIASCGDRAPRVQGYTTIDVSAAISAGGSGSPPVESGGDRLAYVIYTSGSTGAPKGVQISHLALAYYTAAAREAYRLDPGDRVLQFASLGFDASVEEIFPTLTAGATLVLGGEKMLGTTRGFVDASRKAEITVWPLPTAFWSQMVNEIAASKLALPATLRLCILGGERVDPERWTLWKRVAPARIALVNTYGPTEATVVATLHDSNTDASGEHVRREVPIGPTLRGSDAFVLDDALQPLPRGAPGELYLAGPNLSRGYRNDPASTARAFVPNPFASMPGRRMYRTGDIARMLSNGGLEYLGRADSQVKLRGHRVELTEIESVMKECADVSDAAVCVSGDGPSARLIAGIVPRDDAPIDPNSIRTHVRGRLPEFMTPSVFITLDRIPLNRNGKVDRAALAAQTPTLVESAVAAPPATVAEIRMAAIWSRLLNVANPLLDDSFFESGGHSLLATAMVNEISREFGVALTLRQVFEHSTLRSLAQLVEAAQPAAPAPAIPSIETASAAALLGMLDELSEEEVERALARMAASESSVR